MKKELIPVSAEVFKPPLNYRLITEEKDLGILEEFFSKYPEFCFDVETTTEKNIRKRKIRTIQFGVREEQVIIDLKKFIDRAAIIKILEPVLNSNKWFKIGHNLEYDSMMILLELGIRCWNFYDTYLAEKVIECGNVHYTARGFWGMEDLVARYIGLEMNKELQTSFNMTDDLTDPQLFYCACDVRFPQAIRILQLKRAEEHKLVRIIQIENDCIPASVDLQINGFKLIPERWIVEVDKVREKRKKVLEELDKLLIPVVGEIGTPEEDLKTQSRLEQEWRNCIFNPIERADRRKEYQAFSRKLRKRLELQDKCEGRALINYGSQVQLKNALYAMGYSKKQIPDTSDQTLKRFYDDPVIKQLREFRGLTKIITTYYPYINRIDEITGRIHQDLNQLGAESGRMSSTEPNLQNIPKEDNWRSCFEAEEGNLLVVSDFSGQEVGIMAEFSQEKEWVDALRKRWDIHSVVAEIVFGQQWKELAQPDCEYYLSHRKCKCPGHSKDFPDESRSLRDRVKAISFGICYGMQEKKLAEELNITRKEARKLLHTYYASFKDLLIFLNKAGKIALNTLKSHTLLGRVRNYRKITWEIAAEKVAEEQYGKRNALLYVGSVSSNDIKKKMAQLFATIEREGTNSCVQGSAADMIKLAAGAGFDQNGKPFLWHFLTPRARIVNIVHDEIVVECEASIAEKFKETVVDCMVRAAEEMIKSIPFGADAAVNKVWRKS